MIETCPVCGVQIQDGGKVLFSCGPSGTRARLYARVCQFLKDPGKQGDCINPGDHETKPADYYD